MGKRSISAGLWTEIKDVLQIMIVYYWIAGILSGALYSFNKNKKYYTFLNIVIFILAVIVMSCNNTTGDEQNILFSYSNPGTKDISNFTFYVLMDIANYFNLSFSAFNLITESIALALIISTLRIFTDKWGQVLSLYLLVSGAGDVFLFRQFLASSVIIFGFRYLLLEKKKIRNYVICVLIGASIHLALIVYLVFIFDFKKNYYKIKKIFIFASIVCICIFTLLNNRVIPGAKLIAGLFNIDKLDSYIEISSGRFGWLSVAVLCVISIFLCQFLSASSQKTLAYSEKDKYALQKISNISIISSVFIIPCIMYFSSFSRLFRPLVWLMILAIIIARKYKPKFIVYPKIFVFELGYLAGYFVLYELIIFDWQTSLVNIMIATPFWK